MAKVILRQEVIPRLCERAARTFRLGLRSYHIITTAQHLPKHKTANSFRNTIAIQLNLNFHQ